MLDGIHVVRAGGDQLLGHVRDVLARDAHAHLRFERIGQLAGLAGQLEGGWVDDAVAVLGDDPHLALEGRLGGLHAGQHVLQGFLLEARAGRRQDLFLGGLINRVDVVDLQVLQDLGQQREVFLLLGRALPPALEEARPPLRQEVLAILFLAGSRRPGHRPS